MVHIYEWILLFQYHHLLVVVVTSSPYQIISLSLARLGMTVPKETIEPIELG